MISKILIIKAFCCFPFLFSAAFAQSNPAQSFENALNRSLKQMDDAREEQREQERLRIEQERLRIEQEKLKLEREAAERARTTSNNPSAIEPRSSNAPDLEAAKNTCADLGFTAGSEKFGECVLKLMPMSNQAQHQTTQKNSSFIPNDKQKLIEILENNGWKFVRDDGSAPNLLFQFTASNNLTNRSIAVYTINQLTYGISVNVNWIDKKLGRSEFIKYIKDNPNSTPSSCGFAFLANGNMSMRSDIYGSKFYENDFIQALNIITQQQNFCVQRYLSL